VAGIVMGGYERAKKLLSDNIDIMHHLASELLDKEVLNMPEIDAIIGVPTPSTLPWGGQGEKPADDHQ